MLVLQNGLGLKVGLGGLRPGRRGVDYVRMLVLALMTVKPK